MNTMQHILEEASRLLKLVWRVSLPAGSTAGGSGTNQQVDDRKHPPEPGKSNLSIHRKQTLIFLSFFFFLNLHSQDELLKNEIARLKSRLSQQERMLSGAVKRLRTTNQLKEGMERVIIDQCKIISFILQDVSW